MVFDEPGQILACLETIAVDCEVEIVRVNNKLACAYDADLTAGYRCATRISAPSKLQQTTQRVMQLVPQAACA